MYTPKIERHEYQAGAGFNDTISVAWKAHIEDEYGVWVKESPSRDSYEAAQDDVRVMLQQLGVPSQKHRR